MIREAPRRPPRFLGVLRATTLGVCLLGGGEIANAQSYRIDAGSSSLLDADGGTLEVRSRDSSLQISAGELHDGFAFGALFQQKRGDLTVSAGDSLVDFDLPSDLFGGTHNLPLRGARVERKQGASRLLGFAGVSSTTVGAPYFQGGRSGQPLGVLFVDQPLGRRWRFVSRNAFAKRQTSIQAVEWRPQQPLTFAIGGGIGNNRLYGSSSASVDYGWVMGKAVYASHPAGFRRIEIDSPMASEVERENLSLVLRPSSRWRISVIRQNLIQDEVPGRPAAEVTVNEVGASINAGLRLAASVFDSNGVGRNSLGASLSAGRQVTRSVDLSIDYSRFAPRGGDPSSTGAITARESITPRLSLLQVATLAGRSPSFNVGGEFLSNPLSVSVSYQTIYAPLRLGNPFVQVLGVDLRIHGPRGLELRAGTYATPDGSLKYTVSARQILSGTGGDEPAWNRFPKYLVRGVVVDTEARSVEGAVLRIGREVVITDRTGKFSLRTAKPAQLAIAVLCDEFLASGTFEVASAPARVSPTPGENPPEIKIVLVRR